MRCRHECSFTMNVRTPIPSSNKIKMPQKWGEKRNKTTKNKENAIFLKKKWEMFWWYRKKLYLCTRNQAREGC